MFDLSLSGNLRLAFPPYSSLTAFLPAARTFLLASLPCLSFHAIMTTDPDTVQPAMKSTSWNTQDVGYFVPNDTAQRCHVSHHEVTYFTNVHAFVNHVRALEGHMAMTTIRSNIHFYLRGKSLDWHAVELSAEERSVLGTLPLEQGWYKALIDRFQPQHRAAEYAYEDASYSLEDAKARRDPVEWAHNILRHAQAMGNEDICGQLDRIVRSDDDGIRWGVALPNPRSDNMVSEVMSDLEFWYSLWCYEQDHPGREGHSDDSSDTDNTSSDTQAQP